MELLLTIKSYFRYIVPAFGFFLAVLIAWRLIRMGKTLDGAFREIFESPASFIFGIIIIAMVMFFVIKYIMPLF